MTDHSESVSTASEHKTHHHGRDGRTARQESDLLVPLVDEVEGERVYDPSFLWWALLGAAVGGILLGGLAASIAYGNLPVVGLGPFSASGEGVAVSTGGGIGLALGGLFGALSALYRLPKRHPEKTG